MSDPGTDDQQQEQDGSVDIAAVNAQETDAVG
jgi:hypothetical protein